MYSIEKYLNDLSMIFSGDLKSVFIYGSATRKETKNNINLMIIVDNLSGERVRLCTAPTKKWMLLKNPEPVFITYDEWKCSADTYALEYSDIVDFHRIIYGKDYISQIVVKREDLRLQCEREIKSLLMKLRAFYILNSNSKFMLKRIFVPCCTTFMAIFRGILRLNNVTINKDDKAVINSCATISGFSEEVFQVLLDHKIGVQKIKSTQAHKILDNLISELEILLCYVNSL